MRPAREYARPRFAAYCDAREVHAIGDIPVLGWAFRTNSDITDRMELLVLISPYVVRSREEAREVTNEFADRLQGLKRMGEALRARHERYKQRREKTRDDAGGGPAAPSP